MAQLKFSCASVGADTCGFKTTATDKTDLARQLANHLVTVHNVKTPTQTIVRYLIKTAEQNSGYQQA